MTHLLFFCSQVCHVIHPGSNLNGNPFNYPEAISLKSNNLLWIIGHKPDGMQSQVDQYLGPDAVITQISGKPELDIGLNRIKPLLLQVICLDLVAKPYTTSFLPHVQQYTRTFSLDLLHGGVQLRTAVTTP